MNGQPQLFDLQADPHEKMNLAIRNPQQVKELRTLIHNWYPVTQRTEDSVATKPASPG